jgi:hypothetical protein
MISSDSLPSPSINTNNDSNTNADPGPDEVERSRVEMDKYFLIVNDGKERRKQNEHKEDLFSPPSVKGRVARDVRWE